VVVNKIVSIEKEYLPLLTRGRVIISRSEHFEPEDIHLISIVEPNGKTHDFGALCYSDIIGQSKRKYNPASLVLSRKEPMARYLKHLMTISSSYSAIVTPLVRLNNLFRLINKEYADIDLTDIKAMERVYYDFTNVLAQRVMSKEIEQPTAAQYASDVRLFLSVCTKSNPMHFYSKGKSFKDTNKGRIKLSVDHDQVQRTYADMVNVYYALSQYVYSDDYHPNLTVPINGVEVLYFEQGRNRVESLDSSRATEEREWGINRRNQVIRSLLSIFQCMFCNATGCNPSSINASYESSEMKPKPDEKGRRFIALKRRKGNQTIKFSFGLEFQPHWNHYVKLRKHLIDLSENGTDNMFFDIHSAYNNTDYDGRTVIKDVTDVTQQRASQKSFWDKRGLNIPSFAELRQYVAEEYSDISGGDITAVARKLGNSVGVSKDHYLGVDLNKSASELTNYFNSAFDAAITRVTNGNIIPHIPLDTNKPSSEIPVGRCEGDSPSPKLIALLTQESPSPSCTEPEGCLFCEHIGVHADEKDVRKLWSAKHYYQSMKQVFSNHSHYDERIAPIIWRIDTALDDIAARSEEDKKMVENIEDEVCILNLLDPFWAKRLALLSKIGYIQE